MGLGVVRVQVICSLCGLAEVFCQGLSVIFSSFFVRVFVGGSGIRTKEKIGFIKGAAVLSTANSYLSVKSGYRFLSQSATGLVNVGQPYVLAAVGGGTGLVVNGGYNFDKAMVNYFGRVALNGGIHYKTGAAVASNS